MQTRDNLERIVVIKAFIAVRGLGLRQGGVSEETQNVNAKIIGRFGVRRWLPSYANRATLRKEICGVGSAHGKQVAE